MKINKIKLFLLGVSAIAVASSCDIEDLNNNIKNPTKVKPQTLVNSAAKELSDAVVSTNVNDNVFRLYAQYIQQTSYTDESRYNVATRKIPNSIWNNIYRHALIDLNDAKTSMEKLLKEDPVLNPLAGDIAVVDVLESYAWYTMVAVFGDVPYTEAFDATNLSPKYDDAMSIVKSEISQLQNAVKVLGDAKTKLSKETDPVYKGDRNGWYKFANSMIIKLAMLVSDADKAYASGIISKLNVANLITDNNDNASLNYEGAQPNTNPQYADYVLSSRQDFVANKVMLDKLEADSDPRLSKFYEQAQDGEGKKVGYKGLEPGKGGLFTDYSRITERISGKEGATEPGIFVEASEVHFLIVEALSNAMTLVGANSAEDHFNKGVEASMAFWKVKTEDAEAFAKAAGKFDATNWKKSLGVEAWKAYFNRPVEAWTSLRKLDYPQLKGANDNEPEISTIPFRYPYPQDEASLNTANYNTAEAKVLSNNAGKETNALDAKLFWDKN